MKNLGGKNQTEMKNDVSVPSSVSKGNIILVIGESKLNLISQMYGKLAGGLDASELAPSLKEKAQDLETWGSASLFPSFPLESHRVLGSVL